MSQLLFKTEKEISSDAHLPSHQLLLRAGFMKQVSSGIYSMTPLAQRALQNIIGIVRDEMSRVNGQEVLLPVAQPSTIWVESGRYRTIDASMVRFQDRNDQEMVLAMTHEEAVTDLVRQFVRSYRQLPVMVYQVQLKFRDEARPRGGLVRLRECLMKDAYSFHQDAESLDAFYDQMMVAYESFYQRCGLEILTVESDTGMMGGGGAHEFMVVADGGEDTLITCGHCGYAANQEVATARRASSVSIEAMQPIEKLFTPQLSTIEALSSHLNCHASKILKSVLYMADDHLPVLVCVPGDHEVNDVKLAKLLGASNVRLMNNDEARGLNLVPGFVSPVGLKALGEVRIVIDQSIENGRNLVAGANEKDYHFVNVSYGRDFQGTDIGDVCSVQNGDLCEQCGSPLQTVRGIEVGNIFKLGTKYTAPMQANFTDKDGTLQPMVMGCYGIGITRMLACIVEKNHDAKGIVFPANVAPYKYHLVCIGNDTDTISTAAELYRLLGSDTVLYDDREVSAGVKLMDADLLGMPLRITVSKRSLASGGAELHVRRSGHTEIVATQDLKQRLADELETL